MLPVTNKGYILYHNQVTWHIYRNNLGLLEIAVIILVRTEVKHIVYVVYSMIYLKKGFSQRTKPWLSFYWKRSSRRVWRRT